MKSKRKPRKTSQIINKNQNRRNIFKFTQNKSKTIKVIKAKFESWMENLRFLKLGRIYYKI